jgi:DNA invertase Pin-like site-specific DNA recombinase
MEESERQRWEWLNRAISSGCVLGDEYGGWLFYAPPLGELSDELRTEKVRRRAMKAGVEAIHKAIRVEKRNRGRPSKVEAKPKPTAKEIEDDRYSRILKGVYELYVKGGYDVQGPTKIAGVARQIGVNSKTLERWLNKYGWKLDNFVRFIDQFRKIPESG